MRPLAAGVALLVLASPMPAQEPGTTTGALLGLRVAPRPLALGGAYVALADGALSLFHNPAGLAGGGPSAELAFQTLPLDADAGLAAGVVRLGPGALGLGLRFLDLGEIDVVEPDPTGVIGRPTGARVRAGELTASVGYGLRVGRLGFGGLARLLRTDVADLAATGASFDVGAALHLGDVRLAAAVQNVGDDLEPGRAAALPTRLRIGVTAQRALGPRLTARVTAEGRFAEDRDVGAAGIEVDYGVAGLRVSGRVGFDGAVRSEDEASPVVFGGGVAVQGLQLDYAYETLGALGASHHFGLSYTPGS